MMSQKQLLPLMKSDNVDGDDGGDDGGGEDDEGRGQVW